MSKFQCLNEAIQTNRTSFFFSFLVWIVCAFLFQWFLSFRNFLKQKQFHSFPKLITHISNSESLSASKHWPMAVFIVIRFYLFHGIESHYVLGGYLQMIFPLHFFSLANCFCSQLTLYWMFDLFLKFDFRIQAFTHVSCLNIHTQQWVFSNNPHITHINQQCNVFKFEIITRSATNNFHFKWNSQFTKLKIDCEKRGKKETEFRRPKFMLQIIFTSHSFPLPKRKILRLI